MIHDYIANQNWQGFFRMMNSWKTTAGPIP